jgi:hypothetical protein
MKPKYLWEIINITEELENHQLRLRIELAPNGYGS